MVYNISVFVLKVEKAFHLSSLSRGNYNCYDNDVKTIFENARHPKPFISHTVAVFQNLNRSFLFEEHSKIFIRSSSLTANRNERLSKIFTCGL